MKRIFAIMNDDMVDPTKKLLSEIVSLSIKEIVVNSNFDNELILNLKKYILNLVILIFRI